MDPRRSERVSEVYSPPKLKLVRQLCPAPPHPRCHPHVLVGSWCGHRPVYLEFLIVTVLVTLGRRSSCRVTLLWQLWQGRNKRASEVTSC